MELFFSPVYVCFFFFSFLSSFPVYDFFPWFQSWKETHLKCKYMGADGMPSLHIIKPQRKAARNLMELGKSPGTSINTIPINTYLLGE